MTEQKNRTVAILIFENVELLDFAGPYEVFSSIQGTNDREGPLRVFAVAESLAPVRCRNGLVVQPEHTLQDCPSVDILLVPGGIGTRAAMKNPAIVDWVVACSRESELTTSVCTGSFVLAAAGLLDGKPATTYWGSVDYLRHKFPNLEVRENTRWVDAGDVITSAGVSAGIDMALHIVARLYGDDVARATARDIEYDYWPQQ